MAHYAIGDIQGCHTEFCELLERIAFSPRSDTLWLVGDLVNRGPGSLRVLREVMALGASCTAVLGNHDFHLITVAAGIRRQHQGDTLDDILAAPDRDELVAWLTTRPLVASDGAFALVHAGFLPSWTVAKALGLSAEVQAALAGPQAQDFLAVLYGDAPTRWSDELTGFDRLRVIVNACTRLRFCRADDTLELKEKRGIAHTPRGFVPWFEQPARRAKGTPIVCGHWSTLGLMLTDDVLMLDSGCVWGGMLTAISLPERRIVQVPSRAPRLAKPFG